MNLLLFTDNLGSGGAQRQLSFLAVLLKKRGHSVYFITYNSGEHFASILSGESIPIIKIDNWPKILRPFALRAVINKVKPHVVIAFQEAPSFYAEIASLWEKKWSLIVSERNAVPSEKYGRVWKLLRQFHQNADVVTTNSFTNASQIEETVPSLVGKIKTIYNAVDLSRFCPLTGPQSIDVIRFVVLSSHKPQKNFEGLAKAVQLLMGDHSLPKFMIDWFGDEAAPGYLKYNLLCRENAGLSSIISMHPATNAPECVLDQADALILPSIWEGLPNSVCEALSVGCPVLMSDVADAKYLVQEGVTGYLFNPCSSESIAKTMRQFLLIPSEKRSAMRQEARKFAERTFDPIRYANDYEKLLKK